MTKYRSKYSDMPVPTVIVGMKVILMINGRLLTCIMNQPDSAGMMLFQNDRNGRYHLYRPEQVREVKELSEAELIHQMLAQ